MLDTQLSELTVNTQGDATAALLEGGFVEVMTGPKPRTCDDAITTQRVLVIMRFGTPAFKPTKGGVMTSYPLTPGIGMADGEPVWFRTYTLDRRSVFDGSAGKTNANMLLPVRLIVEGATVGCSSLSHTIAKALPGI